MTEENQEQPDYYELASLAQEDSHRRYYRDSAFFLRWGTVVNEPEFLDILNDLFTELDIDGYHQDRKKLALNCVISNLLRANRKGVPVIFSRNNKFYMNNPERYTPSFFTRKNLYPIVNKLIELEYVRLYEGTHNEIKSVTSRIEATQKLLDLFVDDDFYSSTAVEEELDIIQLKGVKPRKGRARLIEYEDTEETRLMRERLENYNRFIAEQSFTVQIPEHVFNQLSLSKQISLYNSIVSVGGYVRYSHANREDISDELLEQVTNYSPYTQTISFDNIKSKRVFNAAVFTKGGRIYTNEIQNLPKEIRKLIKINNEKCVEPDYSAFHIRLTYHKLGIDWPKDQDPYIFGAEGTRKLNKLAVNIMLNSANKNRAIWAIIKEFDSDSELVQEFGEEILQYNYVRNLVTNLEEIHSQVEDEFFNDTGRTLQYEDSCMMMDILEELMNQGIPAISVHDSVMVGESHKDLVLKLMNDKYVERYGFEPKID